MAGQSKKKYLAKQFYLYLVYQDLRITKINKYNDFIKYYNYLSEASEFIKSIYMKNDFGFNRVRAIERHEYF